jgi:hypothetical protein
LPSAKQNITSPAQADDPVISFTQMAIASHKE